jgi:CheY-like chemotaxis protein
MMGGEISVVSAPGKGSTFSVNLPMRQMRMSEPKAQGPYRPQIGSRQPVSLDESSRQKVILAIDDDASARELLKLALTGEGYDVLCASNGAEGLRLATQLRPALITLDLLMPDFDGWSVLAALKANRDLADIPVILITIVDDPARGYALGATEFITKPIDRRRLIDTVKRYARSDDRLGILLVEDDESTRMFMQRTFVDAGCDVALAGNGVKALEQLRQTRPDIIVLDLMMPEMDGFEFIGALQRRPDWQTIPVIVVTGRDLTIDDHRRLNGQVGQIFQKNAITGKLLLETIRTMIKAKLDEAGDATVSRLKKVLYVEDNDDNIVLLRGWLEENGFDVVVAMNGRDGVAAAQREAPDAILMDMRLPVMNGWDATKSLKAAVETRGIPVIGVSAHAMIGDREKALEAGCDDYITKPVDRVALLKVLNKLISARGGEV